MMRLVLLTILTLVVGCSEHYDDRSGAMSWEGESEIIKGVPKPFERTPDGWQQSGILISRNPNKSESMQANFPESGTYTVQFSVKVPSATSVNPEADIFWSVEGGDVKRTVSVGQGVCVTGVGQGVRVVLRDAGAAPFASNGTEYVVGVQVAKGSRASAEKPPILNRFQGDDITAGNGTVFVVPPDVGAISALVNTGSAGAGAFTAPTATESVSVVVTNVLGQVLLSYFYRAGDQPTFFPLPAGAAFVSVDTDYAAADLFCTILWGIDG